ncbi:hypothetical protein HD554DRAFT_2038932 [Boletus coccyginus]|nr:hypothetical protein HD554DRAFT_2038932 [Boletus coccyginus]
MKKNAGAAKKTAVTTCPSLKKFRGVFFWQRDSRVVVEGGTSSGIDNGVGISLGVTLRVALASTFVIEVQVDIDIIEQNKAVEKWGHSPLKELVEGKKDEGGFKNGSIKQMTNLKRQSKTELMNGIIWGVLMTQGILITGKMSDMDEKKQER